MTTQIPDLGPWGTLSDIIEGGINEARAKADEALSRSGTSVAIRDNNDGSATFSFAPGDVSLFTDNGDGTVSLPV